MNNLPIQFADWQPACTTHAGMRGSEPGKAGPVPVPGVGGAPSFPFVVTYTDESGEFVEIACDSIPDLAAALFAGLRVSDVVEVEVVR